jgi:peptidoglycan hydrolase FlgJ
MSIDSLKSFQNGSPLNDLQQSKLIELEQKTKSFVKNGVHTGQQLKSSAAERAAGHETEDERIKKAATDFEALMLQYMFKTMWESVPKSNLYGTGREEEMYRDMLNEELSKNLAENQSLGIKNAIEKDLYRISEKKQGK